MRTFGELVKIWDALDLESVESLNGLKRPRLIRYKRFLLSKLISYSVLKLKSLKRKIKGEIQTPKDLNHLTIGEYLVLVSADDPVTPFKLLFRFSPQQIEALTIEDSIGMLNFIKSELKRISDLFEQAKPDPTMEERQAGVDKVGASVGAFGMIDYIVKRCGCTYEEAEKMPWQRVLAMMRLDRDNELFRRALQNIYMKKR